MNARAVAVGVAIVIVIGGFIGVISFEAENVQASRGSILYVGGSGGGNYSSIQTAVDAASPGDTIFVYNGTYFENVIINKSINLIGENRETTIINGGTTDVINIIADCVNVSDFTIKSYINHWGTGIILNNVQKCNIKNNSCSNNGYIGIFLDSSLNNNINYNDVIYNGYYGIYFTSSSNNTISNNNISLNSWDTGFSDYAAGIGVWSSPNNTIRNNNISSNYDYGIELHKSSDNNKFIGNNISLNSASAIEIYSSSYNWIENNNISNNSAGIYFSYSMLNYIINNNIFLSKYSSIDLWGSSNCTIINNNLSLNGHNGIDLDYSNDNLIIGNNILSNNKYGINSYSSSFNLIYCNNLINNVNQADDNTGTNYWNNLYSTGGNYWSDYTGQDKFKGPNQDQPGSDGIGDTPYTNIGGGGGAKDNYPLMSQVTIGGITPSVPSEPLNFKAMSGNNFINLTWSAPEFDANFSITNYRIYKDNTSGNLKLLHELGNILFFNDTNVTNGMTYFYKVSAVNIIGEGPLSNEVSAMPKGPIIPSMGKIHYVGGTGPNNYTKIQDAIDVAWPIDTIFVFDDNSPYNENLKINKPVFLIGENKETTVINGSGVGDVIQINITYVTISGFTITNSGIYSGDAAIKINDAQSCLIVDNRIIANNSACISLISSSNNTISNNFMSNSGAGITLSYSSNYNIIENNTISNNTFGISSSSYKNSIINNEFSNNSWYGIWLYTAVNFLIEGNNFINDGICIDGYQLSHFNSHRIFSNNIVNGKPILYYKDLNDFEIDNITAGQLILVNCTNVNVKNMDINNTDVGIELAYSENCVITKNKILSTGMYGIYLLSSNNNIVLENNISANIIYGIFLLLSSDNYITNNNMFLNDVGIWVFSPSNNILDNYFYKNRIGILTNSAKCNISNNNLINSYIFIDSSLNLNITSNVFINGGIFIDGTIIEGDHQLPTYNSHYIPPNNIVNGEPIYYYKNCDGLNIDGIPAGQIILVNCTNSKIRNLVINETFGGITIAFSENIIVERNIISDNWVGIRVYKSQNNIIFNNDISSNSWQGLSLLDSSNNRIFHNNFINNTNQAFDYYNGNNYWNETYPTGGNYWSDYNGIDSDGDGIGDTPYLIDDDSQDNYPLMEPWNFTIQEPADITIHLQLTKTEFYIGEPITGIIKITNYNSFDIFLEDQKFQMTSGPIYSEDIDINFIILSDNNDEFKGTFNYPSRLKVNALSSLDIEFELEQFKKLPNNSKDINYTELGVGNYSIYNYLHYGDAFQDLEVIESNSVNFKIIHNATAIGGGNGHGDDTGYTHSIIIGSTIGFILLIIIASLFVTATEVGKYKFFASFVAPLYSRELKKRKKTYKDGFIRGKVLGYILGNPGENYSSIKQKLTLTNGALAYHLKVLERDQDIRSERDGVLKRFYPYEGKVTKEVLELSKLQKRIRNIIKNHLGITQTRISKELDTSVQKVHYHIRLMEDARVIRLERDGNRTKCYILEETS